MVLRVALSYALLGGFAALISYSGIRNYLVGKIINAIHAENSRWSRVSKSDNNHCIISYEYHESNLIPVHVHLFNCHPTIVKSV